MGNIKLVTPTAEYKEQFNEVIQEFMNNNEIDKMHGTLRHL